jgi:hypothetical protein
MRAAWARLSATVTALVATGKAIETTRAVARNTAGRPYGLMLALTLTR